MTRRGFRRSVVIIAAGILSAANAAAGNVDIRAFGASVTNSPAANAKAINAAVASAAEAGGRVTVPAGTWRTGTVYLKSGVELHLDIGAILKASEDLADYNPPDAFPGNRGAPDEGWNACHLIIAYRCENVAITGPGTLRARTDGWYVRAEPKKGTPERAARQAVMCEAWLTQYSWGATNAPVAARRLLEACPKAELRPQFIQMNRCRNVLLDGFRLRRSPFWCIHLYLSENVVARNLDLCARQHNNDAFDIDMTRNVLIENCTLDNADDGFCMKAGRNQDAWRLNTPTENVTVRNCHVKFAHTLLGIGSELSGGIRNVTVEDCTVDGVYNFFFLKTNCRRGGFVKDVRLRNVATDKAFIVASIDTGVFYQYADFPTYEVRPTEIDGICLETVRCREALKGVYVAGDPSRKVRNLTLRDVSVGRIADTVAIGAWTNELEVVERGRPVDIRNAEKVLLTNVRCE